MFRTQYPHNYISELYNSVWELYNVENSPTVVNTEKMKSDKNTLSKIYFVKSEQDK